MLLFWPEFRQRVWHRKVGHSVVVECLEKYWHCWTMHVVTLLDYACGYIAGLCMWLHCWTMHVATLHQMAVDCMSHLIVYWAGIHVQLSSFVSLPTVGCVISPALCLASSMTPPLNDSSLQWPLPLMTPPLMAPPLNDSSLQWPLPSMTPSFNGLSH